MSTQVQLRRDTAANIAAFTGAQGEVVVDTTNNRLWCRTARPSGLCGGEAVRSSDDRRRDFARAGGAWRRHYRRLS